MPPAKNILTRTGGCRQKGGVAGKPFRSTLLPHLEFIRARRRAGATWREIVEALGTRGTAVTAPALYRFFQRSSRRTRWPLGMEPDAGGTGQTVPGEETQGQGGRLAGLWKRKTTAATAAAAETTKPRPYRSVLLPHLALIRAQRAAGESWQQVADALARRGVRVSRQAVAEFARRAQVREQKARVGKESTTGKGAVATTPGTGEEDFSER